MIVTSTITQWGEDDEDDLAEVKALGMTIYKKGLVDVFIECHFELIERWECGTDC